MKIDLRYLFSFVPMLLTVGIIYGTLDTKISALEVKVDKVEQMAIDIAIVKEKIENIERYLIK